VVEGRHLRQWLVRGSVPLALLATNGAGWLDTPALPRFDGLAPDAALHCGVVGVVLVLVSAVLRVLSKGVLLRKTTLTTGGVYRLVRHPFYLATIIGSVGVLVLAGPLGTLVAAVWLVLALPVFGITVAGEEDGLGTLFPERWAAYAAAVPRLLPTPFRLGPRPAEPVRVTWANLRVEGEPPRLLRFLAGALAIAAFAFGGHAVPLVVAGALFAASRLLPGLRPPRRPRAA
jgi:hypothetical protein